jgi:alpha-1,3-rhamnosyltransferase
MNKDLPLVTVCVVTFNSAKFVLEALESVKEQTYCNIELIVSDDCSVDNTVDLCEKWIEENKHFFVNALLITVSENSGTAANCNRALAKSKGEWLKYMAGDDILITTAIENYVRYINNNKGVYALFGDAIEFQDSIENDNFSSLKVALRRIAFSKRISARSQYNILKKTYFGLGSTFFVARCILIEVGGFDLRFPLIEDYPLFLKLTRNGYKLFLMPLETVYRRVHLESVSHKMGVDAIYTDSVVLNIKKYKYLYRMESFNALGKYMLRFSLFLQNKVIDLGNSKKSNKCCCYYYMQRLLDPFDWYSRVIYRLDRLLS